MIYIKFLLTGLSLRFSPGYDEHAPLPPVYYMKQDEHPSIYLSGTFYLNNSFVLTVAINTVYVKRKKRVHKNYPKVKFINLRRYQIITTCNVSEYGGQSGEFVFG